MSIGSRFGAALACAALAGLTTAAHTIQIAPTAVDRVDFSFQIRPLLSDRCFRCHGPDASKRKAKLRLDTREGAFKEIEDGWAIVKPGDPGKSELVRRINSDFEDDVMPPPESHLALSAAEKALLKRWVAEGADYKPHWSLIPVHQPGVVSGLAGLLPCRQPIRSTRSFASGSKRSALRKACRLRRRPLQRFCCDVSRST